MKTYIEELQGEDIVVIGELGKGETATKAEGKTRFIHKCYHDEKDKNGCSRPCTREKI